VKDEQVFVLPHIFIPGDEIRARSKADNVPYDLWLAQGFIRATPGNQVDYGFIRKAINDLGRVYNIKEISYDRWNSHGIARDLEGDGFKLSPIGQGFQSMNAPTSELLSLVRAGKLRHGGHPVLAWMADCMTVKQDPAGNIKPEKPDRNKNKKRIDGIAATIDALSLVISDKPAPASIYETERLAWI